jgi:vacuolar-type H+-ATPase subunit H
MMNLREFLQRFRPVGIPGAASRPGVPADRTAELVTELEPVLALLAGVEDQAERIRRDGRAQAALRLQQARLQAETIVTEANMRAAAVRAEVAAQAQATVTQEWEEIAASTQESTERLRARAAARMPDYVDRAVALALAALGESEQREATG